MEQDKREPENRIVYFDHLRVAATFAVIILHVTSQLWPTIGTNEFGWKVFNFFNSIVRWGVPVFVMMSGTLFLGREIPMKKIYSKYILRMVISFVIWSGIYAAISEGDVKAKLYLFIQGPYHMWFILMIICLYISIPFIKPIAKNDKTCRYYLILAFLFAFLFPQIMMLTYDFYSDLYKSMLIVNNAVNSMNMYIVLGYTSYFILGYYLNKTELTKKQRIIIYFLGVVGFASTLFLDLLVVLKTQQGFERYKGNFNVNILFESIAVFTWFKYKNFNRRGWNKFMKKLSKYSFGAYLVHVLVLDQLNVRLGLSTMRFGPILTVVCTGIAIFIISFSVSAVLNQIPVVRKYMV